MEKTEEYWGREGIKGYLLNVSDRRRRERKKQQTEVFYYRSEKNTFLFLFKNVQGTFL